MIKERLIFFFILLTPLCLSLILFGFTLNYYFFQDDWFNFNISTINSTAEFFNFFKFRNDIIAYRPLEIQTQYFLIRYIFGLNAFTLRVINFSLLFISYFLLLYLARHILKNSKAAFFAATMWVTSSFHFMNLGIINYHLWGTLSWLINFQLLIMFIKTRKVAFFLLAIVLYLISLGIWEFAISLPILATVFLIFIKRFKYTEVLKLFLPFYIISLMYITIRQIFVASLPIVEYQIALNSNSFKALFWYILWAFNVPEEFKKQIANNLIIFRSEFLRDYRELVFITLIGAIILIILQILYPLYKAIKGKAHISNRRIIFFVTWFCITIFPALLLPNHNFIMYLTLPSIGLYLMISYLLIKSRSKCLPYLTLFLWLVLSFTTVMFYKVNMFAASAQKVSKDFVVNMKNNYPFLPSDSIVYYPLPFHGNQQALLDQNAIQALYKDRTINIVYDYESLIKILENTNEKRPVYVY